MSTPPPPMPNAPAVEPPSQPEPALSEPARLINTFIAPSKTFADIRRNASWWVPWLIFSIVSVAFIVTVDKKIGLDQVARTMMSTNSRFQDQSPDQQARTLRVVAGTMKVFGYGSPIVIMLSGVIVAAVLMGTFNFGMAAEVEFGQALAITFYSWLPTLLQSAIGFITILFGNPEGFNMQNPVGTNVAYFMDPATTPKFLYSLMSSLDLVNFWLIALLGIGFALNAKRKISTTTGIVTVGVWYLAVKLGGAAFAAMRG